MLASCQAQPSERVTEMLDRDDNGSDAGVRGRANKLPVICLPGFCSSGLEVRRSAVMPSWIGDRVWFNLKKIMRARTQRSGAAAQGPAQTFTVTVHRAENLSLSLEKDRETIDRLVVKLQLRTSERPHRTTTIEPDCRVKLAGRKNLPAHLSFVVLEWIFV